LSSGQKKEVFGGIIDFISIFGFSFCGVLQSLIVGTVIFDVENVANFADCRYYRCVAGRSRNIQCDFIVDIFVDFAGRFEHSIRLH